MLVKLKMSCLIVCQQKAKKIAHYPNRTSDLVITELRNCTSDTLELC